MSQSVAAPARAAGSIPDTLRGATLAFASGCLGGLTNSLAVWLFGALGVTAAFGIGIAPGLTPPWLYPRIVWGGIWGWLFLIPLRGWPWWLKGLVLSLGPTLVQLLVVFPAKTDQGVLGLGLGALTPVFVLIFNAVWGLTAAWWLRTLGRD